MFADKLKQLSADNTNKTEDLCSAYVKVVADEVDCLYNDIKEACLAAANKGEHKIKRAFYFNNQLYYTRTENLHIITDKGRSFDNFCNDVKVDIKKKLEDDGFKTIVVKAEYIQSEGFYILRVSLWW